MYLMFREKTYHNINADLIYDDDTRLHEYYI